MLARWNLNFQINLHLTVTRICHFSCNQTFINNQFSRITRICQTELGKGISESGYCKAIDIKNNIKNNHILSLDCTLKENEKCTTFNEEAIIPCLQKSNFYGTEYFRSILAIPCDGIKGYRTFHPRTLQPLNFQPWIFQSEDRKT